MISAGFGAPAFLERQGLERRVYTAGKSKSTLADTQDLFSGQFWTGQRAVELGLVDGIGHLVPMMKDRFGDKVQFRAYDMKRNFLMRLGASMVQDAFAGVEERAQFARFGL